jgi:hypothetical protein
VPISWNEIRHNAIRFSKEWAGVKRESAEKQTFWNELFAVFGVRRRTVASFEEPVKKITGDHSFIDLFWAGTLIVEHKSFGQDLSKAQSQAFRYIQELAHDLKRQGYSSLHHRLRFRPYRSSATSNPTITAKSPCKSRLTDDTVFPIITP